MSYIPSSVIEVKSIIEVVNLKTKTRFSYLKGVEDICEIPWKEFPDGFKDVIFTSNGLVRLGPDQESEFTIYEPPEVQPGDPLYAGDPTLYFERKARFKEVTGDDLTELRIKAKAKVNQREALMESFSQPVTVDEEEVPLSSPKHDNVVNFPEAERPTIHHNRPPRDVMKYIGKVIDGEDWKATVYQAYKMSWYGPPNEIGGYVGKSRRKGRYYTRGNEELARATGLSEKTIDRHFVRLDKEKIFFRHKRGFPGQGCSVWELPFSVGHIKAWRRRPKGSP